MASIKSKKILIVEDDELNATLMTDLLVAHGYDTRIIDEGEKVVALAHNFRPDLILMDIQLPEVSGLEVLKWIKDETDLEKIPIVAVTAFAMKGDEKRILDSGCEAYIAKPISARSFLETISQVLEGVWESAVIIEHSKSSIRDGHSIKKAIGDETREKRNACQRKYRRRKNNKIRCFSQTNEQLELIASLWAEGMSARKISENIGYINRQKVISTIFHLGLTRKGKLGEAKPASEKSSPD